MRLARFGYIAAALALLGASCPSDDPTSPGGNLPAGTWGGDNVAMILEDNVAHVHVGCTSGDFPAPLAVDATNRINVAGSYHLRLYPVAVGPSHPARLAGIVDGRRLTFTVAVNDTITKELVLLGPVTVTLGREPRMGPCPICDRRHAERRALARD